MKRRTRAELHQLAFPLFYLFCLLALVLWVLYLVRHR